MQYAQRLLAAHPAARVGMRSILAVLAAFGILVATAAVAALPLSNTARAVEGSEAGAACHPSASLIYPEGQSKPEYVMPVYETGFGVGIDAVLSGWCGSDGEVLTDPTVSVNIVSGQTVTSYPITGLIVELDRPAPADGIQSAFVPTDYLVNVVRRATGNADWEVGNHIFSLTYTSGTVSATTGLFSFVKQDPDAVASPTPAPATEPMTEPTPTVEPTTVTSQSPEATAEPTVTPTKNSVPAPSTESSPSAAPTPSPAPDPSPSRSQSSSPGTSSGEAPSATPTDRTCHTAQTIHVLNRDGSDSKEDYPVYQPQYSIRVSGSGWCSAGTMLDGDAVVEVRMVAYGGYAVPGTVSVPVTFSNGSFDAHLNLSSLYTRANLASGHYFLQVSQIGTDLTGWTNVFTLESPVVPGTTPTDEPTTEPTVSPSASPTRTAQPELSAAPSAEPSTEPSGHPSAQPSQTTDPAPVPDPAGTTAPDQGRIADQEGDPASDNSSDPDRSKGSAGSQADTAGAGSGAAEVQDSSKGAPRSAAGLSAPGSQQAGPSSGQRGGADSSRLEDDDDSSGDSSGSEDSEPLSQASADTTASEDRTLRPDKSPVSPVTSSSQLSANNAGSLSGSRQGNIVNLVLPKAKASSGEWVSVFVFPGATTKGWVQVDDANSVSIDISAFGSGSYELAVADRNNNLLGWARLEISSTSFDPQTPAQAQILTLPDKGTASPMGLSTNDILLGGAGGLLVIGAGSLLVAAHSGLPLQTPRLIRRLRMPRGR